MVDVERIFSFQDELGECPVWNIAEQALYWIDTKQGMIQVYDPKADAHLKYELNRKVGSIAFRKQGRLVVAMEDGFGFYNRHHNRQSRKRTSRQSFQRWCGGSFRAVLGRDIRR